MPSSFTTPKQYIDSLPEDRQAAIRKVRTAVNKGLPKGFKEGIQYGILGWFVPHSKYPDGYHCDPKQPVPYVGLASQKNYMSLYLMCIYGNAKEKAWFEKEWNKSGKKKLNMGKSCVRFKNVDDIPLDVVTKAVGRVSLEKFIADYEKMIPASKRKKKPAKKSAAKKSAAKKSAAKKSAAKRPTAKKKAAKKSTAKRPAAKRKASKKKATRKKVAKR